MFSNDSCVTAARDEAMDTAAPELANDLPSASRRSFFRWFTTLCAAIATAVLSIPLIGYFFGARKGKEQWVDVGPVTDFPAHLTRRVDFNNPLSAPWDGITALTSVYARNEGTVDGAQQFLVLSVYCAHLGCPVSWFPQSGLFMCPCHGGVYYENGERASGPPPRGLYHCAWRVQDGRLQVQAPHYPTLQDPLIAAD
jgi:Rieske Fe-S protein